MVEHQAPPFSYCVRGRASWELKCSVTVSSVIDLFQFENEKEKLRVRVTPKDIEDAREYGGPDAVFQAAPDGTGVYLIHRIRQVARPT